MIQNMNMTANKQISSVPSYSSASSSLSSSSSSSSLLNVCVYKTYTVHTFIQLGKRLTLSKNRQKIDYTMYYVSVFSRKSCLIIADIVLSNFSHPCVRTLDGMGFLPSPFVHPRLCYRLVMTFWLLVFYGISFSLFVPIAFCFFRLIESLKCLLTQTQFSEKERKK